MYDLLAVLAPHLQHLLYNTQWHGWLLGIYPRDGSSSMVRQPHADPHSLPYMDVMITTAAMETGSLRVTVSLMISS